MKRLALVVAMVVLNMACSSVTPDAGQEAVLIRKPMFIGHGGVDQVPVKTGRTFVAWTTDVDYVDMKPQRVDLEFDYGVLSHGYSSGNANANKALPAAIATYCLPSTA